MVGSLAHGLMNATTSGQKRRLHRSPALPCLKQEKTRMTSSFRRNAIVLGLLSAVGPFAIDMYLPALP
ncbi:MAG: Major facilitator transporter, partial [Bradyrhizobium sp.]|nr:Major facilitator transporter [Bradyrhizobium sp.]